MIITFPAVITDIFERKIQKHDGGAGKDAHFSTVSKGWYIQLDGMISIFVGDDRPAFEKNQTITLTIKKMDNGER